MPTESSIAEPVAAPNAGPASPPIPPTAEEIATPVAPPREKRLVPVPPAGKPARVAATSRSKPAPVAAVSKVESKIATLYDADDILTVLTTEAALRRAQRLSGAGDAQRHTIRILSILMLFAIFIAAIGVMWYLQTSLEGSHRSRRAPGVQSQK